MRKKGLILLDNKNQIISGKQEVVAERQSERETSKLIVREIIDHGVSQKQILYIIRNLSLELENPTLTNRIYNLLKEEIERTTIIVPDTKRIF